MICASAQRQHWKCNALLSRVHKASFFIIHRKCFYRLWRMSGTTLWPHCHRVSDLRNRDAALWIRQSLTKYKVLFCIIHVPCDINNIYIYKISRTYGEHISHTDATDRIMRLHRQRKYKSLMISKNGKWSGRRYCANGYGSPRYGPINDIYIVFWMQK